MDTQSRARSRARSAEQAGSVLVVSRTLSSAQFGVDARAHQWVDEDKLPVGFEDDRFRESVGGTGSGVLVEPGELCREGWLGRIAEHGDRSSQGGADVWRPPQTCAYRPADALGAQLAGQASVLAARRDAPPLELAEELPEQERVAAGRPVAGYAGDEAWVGFERRAAALRTAVACSLSPPGWRTTTSGITSSSSCNSCTGPGSAGLVASRSASGTPARRRAR